MQIPYKKLERIYSFLQNNTFLPVDPQAREKAEKEYNEVLKLFPEVQNFFIEVEKIYSTIAEVKIYLVRTEILTILEREPFITTTLIFRKISELHKNENWTRKQIFAILKKLQKENVISYKEPRVAFRTVGPTKGDPYKWALISYFGE